MANYCYNQITFEGPSAALQGVHKMFLGMEAEETLTLNGQKPPFFTGEPDRYFFDIQTDGFSINGFIVSYSTKWQPNIPDVFDIADRFRLSFEYRYEETGCQLFGAVLHEHGGRPEMYELDGDDLCRINEVEDSEQVMMGGKWYESFEDAARTLLDRRLLKEEAV